MIELHKEYCSNCKADSFVTDYGPICCSLNDGVTGKPSLRSRNYHLKSQDNSCLDCLGKLDGDEIVWGKRLINDNLRAIALCSVCPRLSAEDRLSRRKKNQRSIRQGQKSNLAVSVT